LQAIDKIQTCVRAITFEDFASDSNCVQIVLYNYIIIGEAARNIPVKIQALAPSIP
jgi:uncharacterized protein with HEPN domain